MQAHPRYRRVALIGEGGMAQVFLTLSDELGASKLAVVKQLRPELAGDQEHRAMFLDEARLSVRLHHPNIVQTYEVGELGGTYFIAMEYLEGQPLSQVLHRAMREHFPTDLYLYILVETLRGLVYAHELADFNGAPLGVVHRDVTPHNVFLTYDGQVKIVDFGIAKANSSTERTKTGVFKGKATYSSPEQALGEVVDQRADVYSVGVMLWEAVARRRLWAERSETAVLVELVNGRRAKLDEVVPNAPPQLVAICERALAQDLADRYPTSRVFLEALESYVAAQPVKAASSQLASRVSELFCTERERIRQTIEEQAMRAETDRRSGSMPTLLQLAGLALPTESGGKARLAGAARGRAGQWVVRAVAAAVVVLGCVVSVAMLAVRNAGAGSKTGPAASTAAVRASPIAESSAPALPAVVHVRVRTDPESATVLLDGQPFDPSNGFPRSAAAHKLLVTASGYEPRSLDLAFDADQNLSVALRPIAVVPSKPTSPPGPRPAIVSRSVSPKRQGAAQAIDEDSPYRR
jgi:tRNA A-37 threonylcarbamoyl transferase component Bud32